MNNNARHTLAGFLIGAVILGGGSYIRSEYQTWKDEQAAIAKRMDNLEATQKANNENMRAIAEATAADLHDIKAILTQDHKKVKYSAREVQCMALNIYHEAGVEKDKGKIAVGQVTMNRLATKRWGENICDVVYAKAQFSWTLFPNLRREKPKGSMWEDSKKAAYRVLKGENIKALRLSLYYHADYVKPYWADKRARLAQYGQHIFYKQPQLQKVAMGQKLAMN